MNVVFMALVVFGMGPLAVWCLSRWFLAARGSQQADLRYLGQETSTVEALRANRFWVVSSFRRTAPRRTSEKLINRKCSLISLFLPEPQRARYVEEWKDEWMAMRRGDIPKQRFHALRLIRGAVVQSYEERTEVRKQVD